MRVSVIIPVYNAEKFLNRAIESVINQSYKKTELILVNDGSTDNSGKICEKIAKKDKRIKVISQKNSGPAAARNTGIRHATGKFVFFLDADDFIEEDSIKILVEMYNQYHLDLIMSNFSKLETNGKITKQDVTFNPDGEPFRGDIKELSKSEILDYIRHFFKHPSNHLMSYCWARLYNLSIIKNMNINSNKNMRLFEDYVFNLEYLKYIKKLIFINRSLYTYVMQNASLSMSVLNSDSLLHDMNMFKLRTNEFLKETNVDETLASQIKKEFGHTLIHYAIIFFVRSCRQITKYNRKRISNEINKIINTPILRESLKYYSPSKGNSRILPFLMKLRLISLIMFVCNYKAIKRYGKVRSK